MKEDAGDTKNTSNPRKPKGEEPRGERSRGEKSKKAKPRKESGERQSETHTDTRTALILAAGELFAKQGFEGVSTRMIAEKAGVNLGAIHYHFGSKENLYLETFSFIAAEGKDLSFAKILEARRGKLEDPREKAACVRDMVFHFFSDLFESPAKILEARRGKLEDPREKAACVRDMVFHFFSDLFESPRRDWKKRLVIQELFHPSPMMPALAAKIMKPHNDDLAGFYQALRGESTLEEAYIWADMLYAQAFFYLMAREPLGMLRSEVPLEKGFFRTVAVTTARSMILLAGLPLPEDLALGKSPEEEKDRPHPRVTALGETEWKSTKSAEDAEDTEERGHRG
jgi:AcrR family transcriptional regulator